MASSTTMRSAEVPPFYRLTTHALLDAYDEQRTPVMPESVRTLGAELSAKLSPELVGMFSLILSASDKIKPGSQIEFGDWLINVTYVDLLHTIVISSPQFPEHYITLTDLKTDYTDKLNEEHFDVKFFDPTKDKVDILEVLRVASAEDPLEHTHFEWRQEPKVDLEITAKLKA